MSRPLRSRPIRCPRGARLPKACSCGVERTCRLRAGTIVTSRVTSARAPSNPLGNTQRCQSCRHWRRRHWRRLCAHHAHHPHTRLPRLLLLPMVYPPRHRHHPLRRRPRLHSHRLHGCLHWRHPPPRPRRFPRCRRQRRHRQCRRLRLHPHRPPHRHHPHHRRRLYRLAPLRHQSRRPHRHRSHRPRHHHPHRRRSRRRRSRRRFHPARPRRQSITGTMLALARTTLARVHSSIPHSLPTARRRRRCRRRPPRRRPPRRPRRGTRPTCRRPRGRHRRRCRRYRRPWCLR